MASLHCVRASLTLSNVFMKQEGGGAKRRGPAVNFLMFESCFERMISACGLAYNDLGMYL